MHHQPPGPPLSLRLRATARRSALRLQHGLSHPRRRAAALAVTVTATITALLLAVPVLAGGGATPGPLALDASSSGAAATKPRTVEPTPTSEQRVPAGAPEAERTTEAPVAPEPAEEPAQEPVTTPPGREAPGSTAGGSPAAPADTGSPTGSPAGPPSAPGPTAESTPGTAETTTTPGRAPATTARVTTAAASGPEEQVLLLVNEQRAQAGCEPLAADPGLAAVARAHSAAMRDLGFFAHRDPGGRDPFDRARLAGLTARAENIARGQQDAPAVVEGWMASPGHRANILDCGLQRLGVGMATGSGGPWWTQLFG